MVMVNGNDEDNKPGEEERENGIVPSTEHLLG